MGSLARSAAKGPKGTSSCGTGPARLPPCLLRSRARAAALAAFSAARSPADGPLPVIFSRSWLLAARESAASEAWFIRTETAFFSLTGGGTAGAAATAGAVPDAAPVAPESPAATSAAAAAAAATAKSGMAGCAAGMEARSCGGTGGMMPASFGSSPAKPEKPAFLMCALPRQCSTKEMCPETVVPQAAQRYKVWKNLSVCAAEAAVVGAAPSKPLLPPPPPNPPAGCCVSGSYSLMGPSGGTCSRPAGPCAMRTKNSSDSGGICPSLFGMQPANPRWPTRRKCSRPMQCCSRLVSPLHSLPHGAHT